MTKTSSNVHVYSDQAYAVWTAPLGTSNPSTLPPTSPGSSWYEIGLLSDNGITEAHNVNETRIYDLAGALVRIARNQEERPFTFEALESNPVVDGLRFPSTYVTSTASTAEVDTVTVTGSPTGGTFTLTGGSGGTSTTPTIAYNAASSTVQTAIRTLPNLGSVTVTGSAGGPFTVTGPSSGQSMSLALGTNSLTGGTTPGVTINTGTPGVVGTNTRNVGTGTGRNLRAWCVDLVDGLVHRRITIPNGEATWIGTVGYTGGGAAIYQFELQAYKDSSGFYYYIKDDDPAMSANFS